jgi:outer membrane receptor protein involved in Fe transport
MTRSFRSALVSAALLFFACVAGAQQPGTLRITFTIEAQPLPDALNAWAQQAGLQIIWPADSEAGQLRAPRLSGTFTAEAALQQLLSGSGLTYVFVDATTVAIRPRASSGKPVAGLQSEEQRDAGKSPLDENPASAASRKQPGDASEELEEVVVTGTHIRGRNLADSTVITWRRSDIQKSGLGNVGQLIASLPQNFGGGASQNVHGNVSRGGSELNQQLGTGMNLRGLGTGATLTLLNGHRLAPAGEGSFVDVSLIPMSLIERVEILTDGASAIYGSDAIAGVVNIITRSDFEGAETSARAGSVTAGDRDEYSVAQLYGRSWESGALMLNFEHSRQTALAAEDRSFASTVLLPTDLLPSQRTNSVFVSLQQSVARNVKLSGDVLYTRRDFDHRLAFSQISVHDFGDAIGLAASAAMDVDLGSSWRASLAGAYSLNTTDYNQFQFTQPALGVRDARSDYDTSSFDVHADGPMLRLPAGAVKVALGGARRKETSDVNSLTGDAPFTYSAERTITSAYAELNVPIFGNGVGVSAVQALELTLAGRFDRYSDFGDTTNPKAGLAWAPVAGLLLRGTYSKSYRAPPFRQVVTPQFGYLIDVPDPASARPDGLTTSILVNGGNPDLEPETSQSKTFGIALAPEGTPGLRTELTYFDIAYRKRIVDLIADNFLSFLTDEHALSPFITRDPSDEFVRGIVGNVFEGISDFNRGIFGRTDASQILADYDIGAYFDGRYNNVATSEVRGIDVQLAYPVRIGTNRLDLQLLGAYLIDYTIRTSAATPGQELLDTAFQPVDLRLRAAAAWSRQHWSAAAYVNYVDEYEDPGSFYSSAGRIASWTTLDLQVGYEWRKRHADSWLDGLRLSLSVLNLLDKDPPALNAAAFQLGYDAENASPLGRFLSLSVRKLW